MRYGIVRAVLALLVVIIPHLALAQDAAIVGTITDSSGAVLPGVVVQIVHDATGNRFEGVTDARGAFRIPVRPGVVRLTAELSGFSPATRSDLEVLLGRKVFFGRHVHARACRSGVAARRPVDERPESHRAVSRPADGGS